MSHCIRMAWVAILALGMALVVVAQQDSFVSSDGRIQFTVPDGWLVEEEGTTVILANNLEGLDIGREQGSAVPGTIVMLISATANMPELDFRGDVDPSEALDLFLEATGFEHTRTTTSLNGYEVAEAIVTTIDTRLADTQAGVTVLGSANGTAFIIMETGDTLATYGAELVLILESITLAEPAEALATSDDTTLTYNSSAVGILTESTTEVFYTFSGTQGDTVTITMIADDNNAMDTWLWLLTSEGFAGDDLVPIADNDDAEDTSVGRYNSQIKDFVLPETGEYTIRATRLSGLGGFTVTLESDDTPASISGNSLTYNSEVTGTITANAAEQLFTFMGVEGDVITITMIADDSLSLDTSLFLLGTDGSVVTDNDDASDSSIGTFNSQIRDFTLPATGEYTIRATRFSGSGGFTLSLASESAGEMLRQWASEATASSQYGSDSWAAFQATGEPDASTSCSDNRNAWASARTGTREDITLTFAQAVVPSEINIYQVYNPGAIIRVEVANSITGERTELPNSADPVGNTPCPGVFTVQISDVTLAVDTVTIFLDQSSVRSWNEIDAVELVGAAR